MLVLLLLLLLLLSLLKNAIIINGSEDLGRWVTYRFICLYNTRIIGPRHTSDLPIKRYFVITIFNHINEFGRYLNYKTISMGNS